MSIYIFTILTQAVMLVTHTENKKKRNCIERNYRNGRNNVTCKTTMEEGVTQSNHRWGWDPFIVIFTFDADKAESVKPADPPNPFVQAPNSV